MAQAQQTGSRVRQAKAVAEALARICSDDILELILPRLKSHPRYLRHPVFPFIYAAVAHAAARQLSVSLEIFKHCGKDLFAGSLAKYLDAAKSLEAKQPLWGNPNAVQVWSRTLFCRRQVARVVKAVDSFTKLSEHKTPGPNVRIIDIGVGDGLLISRIVNRLSESHRLQHIELVLIDQTEAILDLACQNCRQHVRVPTNISRVCGSLETLSTRELGGGDGKSAWFVNVASCLHHLQRDAKVASLKRLSSISPSCFLTELEGNHDLPGSGAPELVWSVAQFYGALIEDLMRSEVTEEEKRVCINQFLMPEAILILGSDYPGRGNYHTSFDDWKVITKAASCDIRRSMIGTIQPGGPRSMTAWVTPRCGCQERSNC